MPIPPPPPMAFAAVAAAAKVAVKEYLPALSSASLAAWLLQYLWQRVPEWIKEDVVWRRNNQKQPQERLSTLWERHRALLTVAESLLKAGPVPHLPASLLTYLQASSQLRHQPACVQRRNQVYESAGPLLLQQCTSSSSSCLLSAPANTSSDNEQTDETKTANDDENDDDNHDESLERALDWAVWAYDVHDETGLKQRLQSHGLQLERLVQADRPGSVGYFVALKQDLMVIAIKGTSSLEDILTDTCGRAVSYHDEGHESHVVFEEPIEVRGRVDDQVVIPTTETDIIVQSNDSAANTYNQQDEDCHSNVEVISGHERVLFAGGDTTTVLHNNDHHNPTQHHQQERQVRCHEGILMSALAVVREVQGYVQKYIVASSDCDTPPRRLRLVGHSLGASVACFVAMILRSRFPLLASVTHHDHASPAHSLLHVYAFAPPPVVDHDSALACASYVTSIVNNADMIPRCSLINLALWLEVLRSVSQRLAQADLVPATTPKRLTRFVQYIYGSEDGDAQGKTAKTQAFLTVDQIWKTVQEAREYFPLRHPDHLYIPGKVLLFYQDWDGEVEDRAENLVDAGDSATLQALRPYTCRVTDGTALALQMFEVDGFRGIGDHTTAAYYQCLKHLDLGRRQAC